MGTKREIQNSHHHSKTRLSETTEMQEFDEPGIDPMAGNAL